jgi:hypothetical protein
MWSMTLVYLYVKHNQHFIVTFYSIQQLLIFDEKSYITYSTMYICMHYLCYIYWCTHQGKIINKQMSMTTQWQGLLWTDAENLPVDDQATVLTPLTPPPAEGLEYLEPPRTECRLQFPPNSTTTCTPNSTWKRHCDCKTQEQDGMPPRIQNQPWRGVWNSRSFFAPLKQEANTRERMSLTSQPAET